MFEQKPFQPEGTAPITKWSYLRDLRDHLQKQADDIAAYLSGLDATLCGIRCSGCGLLLATEGEFARHFVIDDVRYLNLGNCPGHTRTEPQAEDTLVSQPDEEDVATAQYGSLEDFLAADPWRIDR